MKEQIGYWQREIKLHVNCPYCNSDNYYDYYTLTQDKDTSIMEAEDIGVVGSSKDLTIKCEYCLNNIRILQIENE